MTKFSFASRATLSTIVIAVPALVLAAYLLGRGHAVADRPVQQVTEETVAKSELAQQLADMQTALVEGCQARLTRFCVGEKCDEEQLPDRGDVWSRILGIESTMGAMTTAHLDMRQSCTNALDRMTDLAEISEEIEIIRGNTVELRTTLNEIKSALTPADDPKRSVADITMETLGKVTEIQQILSDTSSNGSSPLAQLWATLRDVNSSLKTRSALLSEMITQLDIIQNRIARATPQLEDLVVTSQQGAINVSLKLPQGLIHDCEHLTVGLIGEWMADNEPGIGVYPLLLGANLREGGDARTCEGQPDMDIPAAVQAKIDLTEVRVIVVGGPGFNLIETGIREESR